ncbi:MAG TPA: tRNA pseudouridine(54/55) synthase Pus10 [archaeon]|nr:tRNA pseudouridine(54/55) synthase Pus10 [archaeon]
MLDKVARVLEKPVCDRCLGRQFSKLLSGYTNKERGALLRSAVAFALDSGEKLDVDPSNFHDFKFRKIKMEGKRSGCWVCEGALEKLDKFAEMAVKSAKGIHFSTFLVGTKPPKKILENEEKLWERTGIEYCEPIKGEINREVGKLVEAKLNIRADFKRPDVVMFLDLDAKKVGLKITPLFIFGYYSKLARNMPQAKWRRYHKTSVEEIIAKPVMKASHGIGHTFHGGGREDKDALCLASRPFVLEIKDPLKRKIDLKSAEKLINKDKRVKVKGLRIVDSSYVKRVKELKLDKTYRMLVRCDKPISKKELSVLRSLKRIIEQRTPNRVAHRRADIVRRRTIKSVKWKYKNSKTFELVLECEGGLYVKEVVSGDEGRTNPAVSSLLNKKCKCIELDVIRIEKPKI